MKMDPRHINVIQLDEITPNAFVRWTLINETQYLSVRDIIMCVCSKNSNYSGQVWRNLSHDKKEELHSCLEYYKFPGQGHKTQPVITFSGAITLIMLLPGEEAKIHRTAFAEIIKRYTEGDQSLCEEIKRNKERGSKVSYTALANKVLQHGEKHVKIPTTEYVYATKSDAFPGLIKIGKTVNIAKRLAQMNTGCAPSPHYVVAVAPTLNYTRDEQTAHAFFADKRRDGEFFEVSETEVTNYFCTHIMAQYQAELAQNVMEAQGKAL